MNRSRSSSEATLEDGNGELFTDDLPMKPGLIESKLFEQLSQNDFFEHAEEEIAFFVEEVQKLGSSFYLVKSARKFQSCLKKTDEILSSYGLSSVAQSKLAMGGPNKKEVRFNADTNKVQVTAEMKTLADSLKDFTIALADFEDYADEDDLLNALGNFEVELRVLSGGLEFFALDDFFSEEFLSFISARATSLALYSRKMTKALNRFRQMGVPCISTAQKRALDMLMNASTIATLFAGVAATTIQYSIETHKTRREIAMNTLWLSSLVLAIGAAMMCMVAIAWKSAVFSSPRRRFSLLFRFWVRSGYLVLLAASAISFLSGLIVYVFNAIPPPAGWVILALTIFCCLGLIAMLLLFFKERIRFSHLRFQMGKNLRNRIHWELIYRSGWITGVMYYLDLMRHRKFEFINNRSTEDEDDKKTISARLKLSKLSCTSSHLEDGLENPKRGTLYDGIPFQQGSQAGDRNLGLGESSSGNRDIGRQKYKDMLKRLSVQVKADSGLHVSHLQFSPDGKWLAVCYAHECVIFNVPKCQYHDSLKHIQRKAEQVEWSPNGSHLLSRTSKSIKLWRVKDEQFIHRDMASPDMDDEVSDVRWLNDNVFLAIVDKSTLIRVNIDISGEIKPVKVRIADNSPLLLKSLCTSSNLDLIFIIATRKVEGLYDNASVERALDCIIVLEMTGGGRNGDNDDDPTEAHLLEESTDGTSDGIIKKRLPLSRGAKGLTISPYKIDSGGVQQRQLIISYADRGPEYWTLTEYQNHRVKLNLKTKLYVKHTIEKGSKWSEACLISPQKNIVSCINGRMMYLWDIESGENENFHQLLVTEKDEEANESSVVSWIGSESGVNVPIVAIAGKNTRLKIWVPTSDKLVLASNSRRNTQDTNTSLQEERKGNRNVPSQSYGLQDAASPRSRMNVQDIAHTTLHSAHQRFAMLSSNESLLHNFEC